jgi:uncharacterized protein YneF (UPF0154 family)
MQIIPLLIIFGAGLITGMYITSQIEKSIDKQIDVSTKKSKEKNELYNRK